MTYVKEEISFRLAFLCYLSCLIMIAFGHLREFMRKVGLEKLKESAEIHREGYVPLYNSFDSLYTRNIFRRGRDVLNIPICSLPGAKLTIIDRVSDDHNWTFKFPGTTTEAINLGSYNYLGYAENKGPISDMVEKMIKQQGVAVCSCRNEMGDHEIVGRLERLVANFVRSEDAVVFGMGFATNSTNIPSLMHKGCLILSDQFNHASIVLGCRLSGATIRVFKHNDMVDLEHKLREAIVKGQPRTHRVWQKIIIIVEGIYSMEGTIVNLPEVLRLKKKYKAYVYLDEAHSIGAMGGFGRGITDYFGCDPKEVDVMMGTFTKSFGAAGGYIAGNRDLINHIRIHSHSAVYATTMAPPIAQQIISVIHSIQSADGKHRIETLARNTRYFRHRLQQLGFIIYGDQDSPVVPLMINFPGKIIEFTRLAQKLGVAVVGASFPATPFTEGRVRFCVSASHTKEMLDKAIDVFNFVGDRCALKYSRKALSSHLPILY